MCDRVSGDCKCLNDNITGRTCDTCALDGYYGLIDGQCKMCKCNVTNTMECDKVSDDM